MTAHELDDSPPISGTLQRVVDATRKLGEQTAFYGQALWSMPYAVRRYPEMVLRQIAGMGMAAGRWPSSAAQWRSSASSRSAPAR